MSDLPGADPNRRRRPFDPIPEWAGVSTRLVHGGRRAELNAGAVVTPIYQTSTFHYPGRHSESEAQGAVYLYSRNGNPSVEAAAEVVRQLEGAEAARLFGSGMGGIAATLFALLGAGDRVVALEDLYGGTLGLLKDLTRFGVRVDFVNHRDTSEPEQRIPAGARLVWVESPTNPTLGVLDLRRWSAAAHAAGALLVVDNTFASPVNQNPIALGADLVVHSATKYLGGHSDLTAGAVLGPSALLDRIDPHDVYGAALDPFAAFLLSRSLKTLALRVERQNANGAAVAAAVAGHPAVAGVHYPGAQSSVEEEIASRQMRGRGGVVTLSLRGGLPAAHRFLEALRLVHVASSLGGVESLASIPVETSHRHLSATELSARGIDSGMVRLSLGIEETADLVRDVTDALGRTSNSASPAL